MDINDFILKNCYNKYVSKLKFNRGETNESIKKLVKVRKMVIIF